jgi:hypothetical protein
VRRRQEALIDRANKTKELRKKFGVMVQSKDDPQARGYGLEDLLTELFEVQR